MAFGGGGLAGPAGAGVGGAGGNPGGGLPFSGIPPEMQLRVEEVLREEPVRPAPDNVFSHRMADTGVSLGSMLRPHGGLLVVTLVLVVIEAITIQAGPLLSAIGIDQGIQAKDWGVLLAVAVAAILCVIISAVAGDPDRLGGGSGDRQEADRTDAASQPRSIVARSNRTAGLRMRSDFENPA